MLEQRDLEMLKGVMESVVRESESKIVAEMDAKMDARFQEMDAKMDARFQEVDARFQEMDAKMDARFQEVDARFQEVDARFQEMDAKMDARFQKVDARFQEMDAKMDTRFRESENMILEDLDRVHINLGNRIDKVQKNLDELNQYYRITKLENDNTAILLKMIQDQAKSLEELSKRVGVLENDKKSA